MALPSARGLETLLQQNFLAFLRCDLIRGKSPELHHFPSPTEFTRNYLLVDCLELFQNHIDVSLQLSISAPKLFRAFFLINARAINAGNGLNDPSKHLNCSFGVLAEAGYASHFIVIRKVHLFLAHPSLR
jgi:hypothetical protein